MANKTPSPAEQRMIKRETDKAVLTLTERINNALGPVAEPTWIAGTDAISAAGGWGADVASRYLTRWLANKPGAEGGWIARNPAYFSGGLSAGLGGLGYLTNLLIPGSKLNYWRQGARTLTSGLGLLGLNRVLTKALDLPNY